MGVSFFTRFSKSEERVSHSSLERRKRASFFTRLRFEWLVQRRRVSKSEEWVSNFRLVGGGEEWVSYIVRARIGQSFLSNRPAHRHNGGELTPICSRMPRGAPSGIASGRISTIRPPRTL